MSALDLKSTKDSGSILMKEVNCQLLDRADMSDLIHGDKVLVFTRMPSDGFDDFMSDPEAVIATVEDMGFDQEQMMQSMSSGDPGQLLQLMEGRWSGEEVNFAFESYWHLLLEKFPNHQRILKEVVEGGRRSQIHTDVAEIRVLNQDQVAKAQSEFSVMELPTSTLGDEADMMLEDLFPALQNFFEYALKAKEFVLVSWI